MADHGFIGRTAHGMAEALDIWAERPAFLTPQGEILTFAQISRRALAIKRRLLNWQDYQNLPEGWALEAEQLSAVDQWCLFLAALSLGRAYLARNPGLPLHLQVQQQRLVARLTIRPEHLVDLKDFGPPEPMLLEVDPQQPALILFTSGTTGTPKAVVLSAANLIHSALGFNRFYALTEHHRYILNLPLFHIGGFMIPIRCLLAGALTDCRQRESISHGDLISLVPTQLTRIREDREQWQALRRYQAVLIGGAPLPRTLALQAWSDGIGLSLTYGCTEACSQLTATRPGEEVAARNVGHPLLHRQLKLVGQKIAFAGPTRFLGYHSPTNLEQPFDEDGFFVTRDLGSIAADGSLYLDGRADDSILIAGETVHPAALEQAVEDGLASGLVHLVPVHDGDYGQRLAVVLWSSERPRDLRSLQGIWQEWKKPFQPVAVFWADLRAETKLKPSRQDSLAVSKDPRAKVL